MQCAWRQSFMSMVVLVRQEGSLLGVMGHLHGLVAGNKEGA